MKKNLILTLLTMLTFSYVIGQDTIWFQDFELPNGTTTSPEWTIDNIGNAYIQDSTYYVKPTQATLTSQWISIDSFYDVTWDFKVWKANGSNSLDNYKFSIKNANGVIIQYIYDPSTVSDASPTIHLPNLPNDSIQLILYAYPRASTRTYQFDNLLLTGTKRTSYPTVTINVKDDLGANLQNIDVKIDYVGTLTTDVSGNVSFKIAAPVDTMGFVISSAVDGYKTYIDGLSIPASTGDINIDVKLETAYNATFNITDAAMTAIVGATISLDGYGDSLTNGSGSVTFFDVATSDSIYYKVTALGYDNYEDSIQINNSAVVEDIVLIKAFNVNITVLEMDGTPVEMADVALYGIGTLQTDNTGTVTFVKVLVNDSIYYEVSSSLFKPAADSVSVTSYNVFDTIIVDNSDTIVWFESFNHPSSTISDNGSTSWNATNNNALTGVTTIGELRLKDATSFISEKFAIDSLNGNSIESVNIYMGIVERSDNGFEGADSLKMYYSLDGATPVNFFNIVAHLPSANQVYKYSALNISGDSLQLLMNTTCNAESYFVSYIMVSVNASAPKIQITPEDAANAIAIDTTILITFDQAVRNIDDSEITDFTSLITLKELAGADVSFNASINSTKDTILVIPSSNLKNNQQYFIEIAPVENKWNMTVTSNVTFTTIMDAPALTMVTPANASSKNAIDVAVSAKFNQKLFAQNLLLITIKDASGSILSGVSASISDSALNISHAAFANADTLTVTVPVGSVRNADNIENAEVSWIFSTIMSAPVLLSSEPLNNDTTVAIDSIVSITFNQSVTSVDLSGITISDGSTNLTGVNASLIGNKITIDHDNFAINTTYTVTIPAGAVKNADNVVNAEITWSFTSINPTDVNHIGVSAIQVLPNPAHDYIVVNVPEKALLTIYDLLGNKVIESICVGKKVVNIQGLLNNVYLIKVVAGDVIYTERLVKQ